MKPMIIPIVKEPDPGLHRRATDVTQITPEIQTLIDSMIETTHAAEGVGLAANQIGSPLNILVATPDGKKGKELVLINSVILTRSGKECSPEGCLSVPGVSGEPVRSAAVTVSGLTRDGKRVTLEADRLLAKILQHEVDHLQGHLFLDRLGLLKRHRLLKKYLAITRSLQQVRF